MTHIPCNLCEEDISATYVVESCWIFNEKTGTMDVVNIFLCKYHSLIYAYLYEYDSENPDPSSYANRFLKVDRAMPIETIRGEINATK